MRVLGSSVILAAFATIGARRSGGECEARRQRMGRFIVLVTVMLVMTAMLALPALAAALQPPLHATLA
jgi:hypothetical protein